VTYKNIFS
jgi:hypothetical protein